MTGTDAILSGETHGSTNCAAAKHDLHACAFASKRCTQAHRTCALTATIQKIRSSDCFCVLDTD